MQIKHSHGMVTVLSIICWFIAAESVFAVPGYINTVAGNGSAGFFGDGGAATSAMLNAPTGVALDRSGNYYVADTANNRIRKITAFGNISTVVGGSAGYSGDGGPAAAAQLNGPTGLTVDGSGNIYIADSGNNCVRKVDTARLISTVAGNGWAGFYGDGGRAVAANLNSPTGVSLDLSGNIYIADNGNNRIRKVDTTGKITTFAGTGTAGYSGDGGLATAAGLTAYGLAAANSGALYIADSGNNRIRKIDLTTGKISTVAGSGSIGYSGDGGLAIAASLNSPGGLTVDGTGNLYISDTVNARVRKVAVTSGVITTVTGNGTAGYMGDNGPAFAAKVNIPTGLAADGSGNLFIADTGNDCIRKVSATVSALTTASPPGGVYNSIQFVTLIASKPATIYYTLDGSLPTVRSQVYTAPITISASATLKYFSVDFSGNPEVVTSAVYVIDTVAPTTSPSIAGGVFKSAQTVTLGSNEPATIYYTTDGTAPSTSSKRYSLPISITATTTLKFFAVDIAGNTEAVKTQNYTIDTIPPFTTATPAGGTYSTAQSLALTTNETATIYYTLDGTTPTVFSPQYNARFNITSSSILKYFSVDTAGNSEAVKTQIYMIQNTPPVLVVSTLPDGSKTRNPLLNISGTVYTIGLRSLTVNNTLVTVNSDGTFSYALTLVDGANTVTTVATDNSGRSAPADVRTITLDRTAPQTTVNSPGNNSYINSAAITVTGSVNKVSTVQLSVNGGAPQDADMGASGTSFTKTVSLVPNSVNAILITATDQVGNSGSTSLTVTSDETLPALDVTTPLYDITTLDSSITITGRVSDGMSGISSVTVSADALPCTPYVPVINADGSFSSVCSFTTQKQYAVLVTAKDNAVDAAGNPAPNQSTVQRNVIYSLTAPQIDLGSSVTRIRGNTVSVPLNLTNVAGTSIAAISLDIDYDPNVFVNPIASIGPAGSAAGKTLVSSTPSAGVLRVGVFGTGAGQQSIADGTVANITFTIDPSAPPGPYYLSNYPTAADSTGNAVGISGNDTVVTVITKPGDCNYDGTVSIAEVQSAISMFLGNKTATSCVDLNGNLVVEINEVQQTINGFLGL